MKLKLVSNDGACISIVSFLILISAESRIALIGFQFLIDLRGQHHFWIPLFTVFSPKLTVQITLFVVNMGKVSTVYIEI